MKAIFLVTGVVILLLLIKVIVDTPYRSKIPSPPDLQVLTASLQDQIKAASGKAHRNPTVDNLGTLGMVYHSSANYEKAKECYKLAVRKDSTKWIWSYYLGYLNKEMGESANAIKSFENVVKENPEVYHAWYYIGEGYQDMGSTYKAELAFKKISSLEVKNPAVSITYRNDFFPLRTFAKYQLARLYLNTNQIKPAENTLIEIIKNDQTFGSAYRILGSVYRMRGDSLSSRNYINRANDLLDLTSPVDTLIDMLALRSRSELYILKQIDEAENARYSDWALVLVNQALKYMPDDKYVISKAIKHFLKMGSGNQVLSYLTQNIQNFKDDYEELKQVADLLYAKGFYSQSNIYYNRIIELKPENTEIQANLVFGLLNEGKKQQAIVLMDQYLKKYSENPKVYANAVYMMLLMKENEKAKYYLEKLKKLSPSGSKTLLLAGRIAQQEGNIHEAQVMYESAFKGDPGDLLCIQSLGDVLMRQNMWSRSIEHFKKALEFFPNEPYILERIGTLLTICPDPKLRNYSEAKEYLERVFIHKACPSEIMISAGRSLAQNYASLGDKQKASLYMRFVLELAISNNAPKELLDELERKLKEYGQ